MLSGTWRRSVGPQQPAAPPMGSAGGLTVCGVPSGTVVLEAQYDYNYRGADGRQVCIREGERFVLLKKTNVDWWQVRRIGAASKAKPLYVPATYVTEVPIAPMPSPQRLVLSASLNSNLRTLPRVALTPSPTKSACGHQHPVNRPVYHSMENLNYRSAFQDSTSTSTSSSSSGGRFTTLPFSRVTFTASSPTSPSGHLMAPGPPAGPAPPANLRVVPTITRSQSSSNLPENPTENLYDEVGGGHGIHRVPRKSCSQWDVVGTSGKKHHLEVPAESYLSQLSWQNSPVYTEMQPGKRLSQADKRLSQSEPPCPGPGQQPVQVTGLWERYSDPATGRSYYVHTVSRERSWKPPRRARGPTTSEAGPAQPHASPGETSHMSLPLAGAGNGSHKLSPDFLFGSHQRNADGGWQMKEELEKAGLLNKTKIAEGGRKLRKNWSLSWVVLVGNSLVFFKDPKSQTPSNWKPGNSRPESSVDLRGAQLHWANELSSKKNVFKLRTVTGNEFLLQSETDSLIKEWYKTIQHVIEKLDRENPLDNVLLYSLRRAGSVEMLDHSGDEDERRKSLPRSSSNLENTERKRVKTRLKKLILKRPPLQALQEKGLIKDQVFGCRLEMLCERERSTVPRFVRLCTEAVERRGLDTDGIYRVSGNLAVIQKLRFLVNHERAVTTDGRYMFPAELVQEEKLNLDSSEWEDIHVITGALKLFFRELPEPLVPYGFFTDIVETVKMSDHMDKVDRLKCLVLGMPPPNHDTLQFMCQHLKRVLQHKDANRMSTQNIGIVFGPTLMRPEKENGNIAVNMVYQNQAVELILSEYDHIFGTRGTS
ncbi:rho GTPase-activating protein 9 isoform X4 [Betta splendens]|uniref:Rho GTPase-activating protein 9 isoform X4 n=1 Tax=Betta splendens TaxID=158456 RepID=A0A9W2XTW6_BETSP|nr:rho GTPase-activating protein 9 isoform X4 [Betta splendens]